MNHANKISLIVILLISSVLSLTSCKKEPNTPILGTTSVSAITQITASSGGNITDDGGASVTARGVCWNISDNPTVASNKTSNGTGTGSFTSSITQLIPNTKYYVKAYAVNSAGAGYGSQVSFTTSSVLLATLTTTAVTSVTSTTAISGGDITADGGGAISARGVCWNTSTNPTISNNKTTDDTGIGSFASNLANLQSGTTYYVKAYATNSAGTAYGNELTFKTAARIPTLTTTAISGITRTTATSGGNIASDGGSGVTAHGVCWGTTTSPTFAGMHTTDGTGTGSFTSNITGLTANTTYYVRAYATNSVGIAYGNELSFTTSAAVLATVNTAAISNITLTSATCGGIISNDGGASVTARGVCFSRSPSPTIANRKTDDGTGTGSFTSNLTGLEPGITYYVRAYASNSAGDAYGNEVSFTTKQVVVELPTLTTTAVTSITSTTAVSGGNITADGGGAITDRGVCFSRSPNPTTGNRKTNDGSGTGSFTSNITGLEAYVTYYVRAYASNSAGDAYGNEVSFTTGPSTLNLDCQLSTDCTTLSYSIEGETGSVSSELYVLYIYDSLGRIDGKTITGTITFNNNGHVYQINAEMHYSTCKYTLTITDKNGVTGSCGN
jgi:hypothetical protein